MRGSDIYHIGVIVPQLETAMAELTDILGLAWGPVVETGPSQMIQPGSGTKTAHSFRIAFSQDQPHFELIEELPGTLWVCNPYSNLHHVGFWGAGLVPESSRIVGAGCPVEIMGLGPDDGVPLRMAYHRNALGVRIEVVDVKAQRAISALWAPPG